MEIEIKALDKIYNRIKSLKKQIIRMNTEFEMLEATLRVFDNETGYIRQESRIE